MKQPGLSWNRGWRNWQLCLTHSSQTTRTVRRCSRRLILSAKCKSCWKKESLIICSSRFFCLPRDSDKLVLPSLKTIIYTQAATHSGTKNWLFLNIFLESIYLKFLLGRVKLFCWAGWKDFVGQGDDQRKNAGQARILFAAAEQRFKSIHQRYSNDSFMLSFIHNTHSFWWIKNKDLLFIDPGWKMATIRRHWRPTTGGTDEWWC